MTTEPPTTIELREDHVKGLSETLDWLLDAKADLGQAYLRREDARREFERADKHLERILAHARDTEDQHQKVLAFISADLQLPPGEWFYDGSHRRLVRKGSDHADPL